MSNEKNSNLKSLIENYQNIYAMFCSGAYNKIEVNSSCNYILLETEDSEYFLQGEECENLIKEYENSCIYDYVTLKEYIVGVSQNW